MVDPKSLSRDIEALQGHIILAGKGARQIDVTISPELQKAWDNYQELRELQRLEKLHRSAMSEEERLGQAIRERREMLMRSGVL